MVSTADVRTYVYGATYDSWNRVRTMTYPDGEVVTYGYNAAGQVESIRSERQGKEETIVEEVAMTRFNSNVRMVKGTSFLSSMTALFNIVSIFTDSPNSPIYIFLSPGEGKQNRAYVDFMTGQIYEWSLRGNNIREVRFYKDYKRIRGTWRGIDLTNKQYFDKTGKPLLIK